MFERIQRFFKGSNLRTVSRCFTPGVELLEDRLTPAGALTSVLSNGTLTITASDDLAGVPGQNNQNLTITGTGAGSFMLSGNDGETFVGGTSFTGVRNIKLVLKQGFDVVTVTNADLAGTLTFLGGGGTNILRIDAVGGSNTLGSVVVNNGDGLDTFAIVGGTNTIRGNVTINNGLGGSSTTIGDLASADVTTIGGSFTVTNQGGQDGFQVEGALATFSGPVSINNGSGGSRTAFNADTTALPGGLRVNNGAGINDFSTLQNTTFTVGTAAVRRHLTLRNGNGRSFVTLEGATHTINGNFRVTNGAGADIFTVGGADFSVTGAFAIRNGNGDSEVTLESSNTVTVGGTFSLTNGDGDDRLDVVGGMVRFNADVTIVNGAGDSDAEFTPAAGGFHDLSVAGDLSITGGDGFDEVEINFALISGDVTLDYGAGGSDTEFNQISSASVSTLQGRLTILATDGVDLVGFQRAGVGLATAISLGEGNDEVGIEDAVFTGPFRLATGAGDDVVEIETRSNTGALTHFQAAAVLDAGSGDDVFTLGLDADDFANFEAAATLLGGADLDMLIALANVNNRFASPPVESGWEQGT